MRHSSLFSKTRREAPKDEVSKNASLLIRAGFIHKEMAGVYSYLPLGLRTLRNIERIIREEMDAIGGQELMLATLQDRLLWEKTNRWDDARVDNWFKTKLKNNTELGLGFTHEEPLTSLMRDHILSWRDLPAYVYQIQTKFRNEARAKSGIMRAREFLMKDLYSFSKDEDEHLAFYSKVKNAYQAIFARVGIGDATHLTFASGGSFSKYSHEFQMITEAGEDEIHVCNKCSTAINNEIFAEQNVCPECGGKEFKKEKATEVGNIFSLGNRFSTPLGLQYSDEEGEKQFVIMGSYGIGLGRLLGAIVELYADAKGIVWPESVAPFKAHLLLLDPDFAKAKEESERLYAELSEKSVEVLFDDRPLRAGEKFTDADLIGIPWRVVISKKGIEAGTIELKQRNSDHVELVSPDRALTFLSSHV